VSIDERGKGSVEIVMVAQLLCKGASQGEGSGDGMDLSNALCGVWHQNLGMAGENPGLLESSVSMSLSLNGVFWVVAYR